MTDLIITGAGVETDINFPNFSTFNYFTLLAHLICFSALYSIF